MIISLRFDKRHTHTHRTRGASSYTGRPNERLTFIRCDGCTIYWFRVFRSFIYAVARDEIAKHKFSFHFNVSEFRLALLSDAVVLHENGLRAVMSYIGETHLLKATASVHICIIYSAKHFALPQLGCATLDFRFFAFYPHSLTLGALVHDVIVAADV